MKQAVLFKNTGVIVHRTRVSNERPAENEKTVIQTKQLTVELDAAAAEVLVGYLQVIRAYLANSNKTRQQVTGIYERVAADLEQQLKFTGRTTAEYDDIKRIIHQLGCLHDWATNKAVFLQERESHN